MKLSKRLDAIASFINDDDKLSLLKEAINRQNYDVINVLLREIDNIYLGFLHLNT